MVEILDHVALGVLYISGFKVNIFGEDQDKGRKFQYFSHPGNNVNMLLVYFVKMIEYKNIVGLGRP